MVQMYFQLTTCVQDLCGVSMRALSIGVAVTPLLASHLRTC